MFNTKETYPNQTLNNDLCQAVRAGNTVYVRGQVGTDFDGNLIGWATRAPRRNRR
jgi:enamine deaminase RidA (YjgF/YER057c/UK114 family)